MAIRSQTASICPVVRTSSGMKIAASSSRASGSTYFLALSLRYVTANSAPSARKALAQPQAIDCSLAMPTTRPRLPSRTLTFATGIMGTFPSLKHFYPRRLDGHFRNLVLDHQLCLGCVGGLCDGHPGPGLQDSGAPIRKQDPGPFRCKPVHL